MLLRSLRNQSSISPCCAIVLVDRQGRLGNRMFMFASAIGLALTYSCQLAIESEILSELESVFTINLSQIPKMKLLETSRVKQCADQKYNYCNYFHINFNETRYHVIELTGFWQSYRFFDKYRRLIKNQFIFKHSIKQKITHFFHQEGQKRINRPDGPHGNRKAINDPRINGRVLSLTWVGVHVRRGDFLYLRQVSSMRFVVEAMNYFEKKYTNVIFLITSDDKTFCKRMYGNMSNVVITPVSFSTGEDLAALAACHHMIVTVGTYGWWAGFLTEGEVLHDVRFSETPTL